MQLFPTEEGYLVFQKEQLLALPINIKVPFLKLAAHNIIKKIQVGYHSIYIVENKEVGTKK